MVTNSKTRLTEILRSERDTIHRECSPPEIIQHPGISGKIERKLVRIKGLTCFAIFPIHFASSVLSITKKRTSYGSEGSPDLMSSACLQFCLHQTKLTPRIKSPVSGGCGLSSRNRFAVNLNCFFVFVFQEKTLNNSSRRFRMAYGDAEIPFPDFSGTNLLIDNPQGFCILCCDYKSSGISVNAVA